MTFAGEEGKGRIDAGPGSKRLYFPIRPRHTGMEPVRGFVEIVEEGGRLSSAWPLSKKKPEKRKRDRFR